MYLYSYIVLSVIKEILTHKEEKFNKIFTHLFRKTVHNSPPKQASKSMYTNLLSLYVQ